MFGVGEHVQREDLNIYATKRDNEKHVFIVTDMEKLHTIFADMIGMGCLTMYFASRRG